MPDTFDRDDEYELERQKRRARRIAEMKRKKKQQELFRKLFIRLCPVVMGLLLVILIVIRVVSHHEQSAEVSDSREIVSDGRNIVSEADSQNPESPAESSDSTEKSTKSAASTALLRIGTLIENAGNQWKTNALEKEAEAAQKEEENALSDGQTVYSAATTDSTDTFFKNSEIQSTYGIVVDPRTNTILAEQNAHTRVNPASMTKVLTVLVAAEHVTNLDDTFTIPQEINDYVFTHDCSVAGFDPNEVVTVRDLFYGTILPSGADAALGLAYYVAGSQEAFVELMNEKLDELGLSSSAHFTNCIGLYDENHYCTMYDMAMIMEAALDNELCKEVMSVHIYTTSSTPQHPEGLEISNWFLRKIEDKDTHGEVVCGKTGYVAQSGNCAVSYGTDKDGNGIIIVTGNAPWGWRCIHDHVALYQEYL